MTRNDWAWVVLAIALGLVSTNVAAYTAGYNVGYEDAKDYWGTYKKEVDFWREMYHKADHDSKFVNCLELDPNYVICEKPAHAQR